MSKEMLLPADKITILGVDPSTVCTGVGIISGVYKTNSTSLEYVGLIRNKANRFEDCLKYTYDAINETFALHKINVVGIEDVFLGRNYKTSHKLAQVSAVIMLACKQHNIYCQVVPTKVVKKLVTGKGNSSKEDVKESIIKKLDITETMIHSLDASDAIAVALSCFYGLVVKTNPQ